MANESECKFIKSIFFKIKKYKLFGATLCLAIGQALYIFLPALLGWLIDAVFVKNNRSISWLFLFPALWSLSHVFLDSARFFISSITQDVRYSSKESIFRYLISLSNSVYNDKGAGEVESLMQEISFNTRYFFTESLPFFMRIFVSMVMSILIVCSSSFWLGFFFAAWFLLYIPLSYTIAKRAVNNVSNSLLSSAEVSAATVDIIENHELIPAFGTETFETTRFQKLLKKEWTAYGDAQFRIDRADLFQHAMQLLLPFGIVFFMIFTQDYLEMSPGNIVALLTVSLVVAAQIRDFGKGVLAFFEVKERMKTVLHQLMDFQKFSQVSYKDVSKIPLSYEIKFEKVGFSYHANEVALHKINLLIKESEKIGIIGYSGAGKSTLMRLLKGFYAATSGKVSIGGICLKDIDRKFLAETISEVSQTIPLFHRSIRENIAYGCDEIADDKIWHILERAQFAEEVKKLPQGLDTIIGVKGSKLSGGERARLAIARAFLKNSKIIILDEATASLDSESEYRLQKGLEELMKGRTVIAIAHRLSALRSMDRLLVFEKGQIVAEGAHNDLLQTNELYKKLWSIQS